MNARPKIILPLAVASVLIALSIATQSVAHDFHYPREFGHGLLDLGPTRIYAPWAFVGWYGRFAAHYQQAFDMAAMIAFATVFVPLLLLSGLS